jgi:hypothetical protein
LTVALLESKILVLTGLQAFRPAATIFRFLLTFAACTILILLRGDCMPISLVPIYFKKGRDADFDTQLQNLKELLGSEVNFLSPVGLGDPLPEADAAVFPQFLGEAYREVAAFKDINIPILVITSEFGTVSMWDWEIVAYLKGEGVEIVAPYNLEQTKKLIQALKVKRDLSSAKFLVFQDNPGEGFQAEIFKRFYWWEDECIRRMNSKFGVTIVKKSYRELATRAKNIPDSEAEAALKERQVSTSGLTSRALNSAIKLYLAVKSELDQDAQVHGVGINCLNESHFSDTTPCLAWNLLYEERKMIWGCEADIVTILTEYILNKSLGVPVMMTNMYPFLMGQAALKHEHIPEFPNVPDFDDHILAAHCGYLGVVPTSFSTEWTLRPKVLAIVDDNASAIDARLPEGAMTLAKLDPGFEKFSVVEGQLESYVQYTDSHCLNGAVLHVPNGERLTNDLISHHYILMTGHQKSDINLIGKVFKLQIDEL